MDFSNYKQITASLDDHMGFLRTVADIAKNLAPGQDLHSSLSKISVEGKPFSMARHLMSLEDRSDDWDLVTNQTEDSCAAPDSKKVELIQLTRSIMGKEPSYDLAFHTTGYRAMTADLESRGISIEQSPSLQPSASFLKLFTESGSKPAAPRARAG